ncbi:MAG: CPBP family intramembrane glutamic endopeptidase [Candidatus Micrarchaeia archaeon]
MKSAKLRKVDAHAKPGIDRVRLASGFFLLLIGIMLILQIPIVLLYYADLISYNSLDFLSTAMLSMSFSISAFAYLMAFKKLSFKDSARELGLGRKELTISIIAIGIVLFLAIFALEGIVTAIESYFHITISTNVAEVMAGAPMWFYIFVAIVAPINEEILFRGLLVPRIGIVASAVVFALLHYTYYSSYGIEVIAALVFGLLAGYVYKKTGSLYASTVAHVLVNIFAVINLLA